MSLSLRSNRRHVLVNALAWSLYVVGADFVQAFDESALQGRPSEVEIADWVRDLGNPSYDVRTVATQRLTAVGVRARRPLEAAAAGTDYETVLRAKQLLETFDRVLFAGVEVSLALSEPKIAWNQSVDLLVTLTNRSEYPARVPFGSLPNSNTNSEAVETDAQQVGRVLDMADWLKVRDPNGMEVDLRVDDISADLAVVAAVQARLSNAPTAHLEPGRQVTLRIRAVNRGWARYPMLEQGTYTLVLDYNPEWEDGALNAQRVGRVVSDTAKVQITDAAPKEVSRNGVVSTLSLSRSAEALAVHLTNASDQVLVVNRSFGFATPFAQGKWLYQEDDKILEIVFPAKAPASWDEFIADSLVELEPGRSVELVKAELPELRKKLLEAGAVLNSERGALYFSYSNLCDRQWQLRQGSALLGNQHAPTFLRDPLPRRMLTNGQKSNELTAASLR